MPAKKLSMHKLKEILRLKHQGGMGARAIARCLGLSHSTVIDYLNRARAANLVWPLPEGITDEVIEAKLFAKSAVPKAQRPIPDWTYVHQERKRKGVTLELLWEEYKRVHPDGYQYSWFCERYRAWKNTRDLVMHLDHAPGQMCFVDYSGLTMSVVDPETGELRKAQIFVATLGYSNYTYVEATWTQALRDWVTSHRNAFTFFGAVPQYVVPDNLKAAVIKAHQCDPDLNPTYYDLATHYGTLVIPARAYKARDKAKVEKGVQWVQRQILAPLRNQTFCGLHELNKHIQLLLTELNNKPFQKLDGSRSTWFKQWDQPAMRPLPKTPYVFGEWRKAKVHRDYHIEVAGHRYSVPYTHARKQVDVRITDRTVEVFLKGQRIASHLRNALRGRFTTQEAHMPEAHRQYYDTKELCQRIAATGPATEELITRMIEDLKHPVLCYRSLKAIERLGHQHGAERLEAACRRALEFRAYRYASIASILKRGLDHHPTTPDAIPAIQHANIRGADYYNNTPSNQNTHANSSDT